MFCLHFCAVNKFVNQVYQVLVTSSVTCQNAESYHNRFLFRISSKQLIEIVFLPKESIKIQNIFHLFTSRVHVSVKVSLHAFLVIVSTVAAHIFFSSSAKVFQVYHIYCCHIL